MVIPANMNGNETIQALLMRVAASQSSLLLARKEDENEMIVRGLAAVFGFEENQLVDVYLQCKKQNERIEESVSFSSSLIPIVGALGVIEV